MSRIGQKNYTESVKDILQYIGNNSNNALQDSFENDL